MAAARSEWLTAFAQMLDASNRVAPCPSCGNPELAARYVIDEGTRMGYALFWCNSCLEGITVSRAKAPSGVETRSFDDADPLEGVPRFTRIE
jgi:hypothetical protein